MMNLKANVIAGFQGQYRFLSNFWMKPFTINDWRWPSAEHAYQASKSVDPNDWIRIQRCAYPGQAKRMGANLPLRNDWDEVKIQHMRGIIDHKFDDVELAEWLVSTGNTVLVELNHWGDTFWGVSKNTGKGENHLGLLLMEKKDILNF